MYGVTIKNVYDNVIRDEDAVVGLTTAASLLGLSGSFGDTYCVLYKKGR